MEMKKTLKKITTNAMVTVMKPIANIAKFIEESALNVAEKYEEVCNSLNEAIKAKEEILAKLNEENSTKNKKQSKLLKLALNSVTFLIDELEKLEQFLQSKLEDENSSEEETEKVGFFKKAIQSVTTFVDNSKTAVTNFVDDSISAITDYAETVSNNVKAYKNSKALSFAQSKLDRIEEKRRELEAEYAMYNDKYAEVSEQIDTLKSSDLLFKKSDKATKRKKKSIFIFRKTSSEQLEVA